LRATAQLRGDVRAAKLLVVEGASFVGRCEVGPNVGATAPAAAKPPTVDGAGRPVPPAPVGVRH
jgi:cytoskeletal protein CcmA (bactofilin family)